MNIYLDLSKDVKITIDELFKMIKKENNDFCYQSK